MNNPRALIVDDDLTLLECLPRMLTLRMPEVCVDTADSARRAMERIAKIDYDAIVTDIKMPGMDGLALLREIKTLWPQTPTLLITGHGEHDLAIQALRGGAYDFIQKPIDREYFLAALARAIQNRGLCREVERQRLELQSHAAKLEAAVRERTRELMDVNDHLSRAMTETHHRVKNNLQLVSALLDILTMEHKGKIPVSELRRLGAYISTLASVHDLLTQEASRGDGLAQTVSSKAVIGKLLNLMQSSTPEYSIQFSLDDVRLSTKQGTSLALVAHELVNNAMKYGKRDLFVSLAVTNGGAKLMVADDGPGFPPDFDPVTASNTGLELVEVLSRWDLRGCVSFHTQQDHGGRVLVEFPVSERCPDDLAVVAA